LDPVAGPPRRDAAEAAVHARDDDDDDVVDVDATAADRRPNNPAARSIAPGAASSAAPRAAAAAARASAAAFRDAMVPGDGDAATWVGGRSAPRASASATGVGVARLSPRSAARVKPLRCPSDRARVRRYCAAQRQSFEETRRRGRHSTSRSSPVRPRRVAVVSSRSP
jgi:hypothetical protein